MGPLGAVGWQEYSPEYRTKSLQSAREAKARELGHPVFVEAHLVAVVQDYQAGVEGSMVRGTQRDSVSNMVSTLWRADRQDVCGLDEAQLHARHRARVTVREKHFSF